MRACAIPSKLFLHCDSTVMVFFTCNACGSSVKKNQVEKHYQCECPRCEVLSCMDCGRDFYGDEYATHTKCISEAEKYQSSLFRENGKAGGKGEKKQQKWLERVQQLVTTSTKVNPRITRLLERISQYPNIPRKKSKFENFVRNSVNVRDQQTLGELWELFSTAIQPVTTADTKSSDVATVDASAGIVTSDSETNKTCLPIEKVEKQETKLTEERLKTGDDSVPTTEVHVAKPKKLKTKKKGRECRLEAEENQTSITEDCLDTSAQVEEMILPEKKKKKKKRKHEFDLSPTAEEAVHSTTERCGELTCEKSDVIESVPPKKKRKKLKTRETGSDGRVPEESGVKGVLGVEPTEVAREYINGCRPQQDEVTSSDVLQEGERTTLKKSKKKHKKDEAAATGVCEEQADVVLSKKTKSKKDKKHKH